MHFYSLRSSHKREGLLCTTMPCMPWKFHNPSFVCLALACLHESTCTPLELEEFQIKYSAVCPWCHETCQVESPGTQVTQAFQACQLWVNEEQRPVTTLGHSPKHLNKDNRIIFPIDSMVASLHFTHLLNILTPCSSGAMFAKHGLEPRDKVVARMMNAGMVVLPH